MLEDILKTQKTYFNNGDTKIYSFRINALKTLKNRLVLYKTKLQEAFIKDFNKCEFDFLTTEYNLVLSEIDYFLKHLKSLIKPKKVKTGIINFSSHGYIYSEPYGVVLIISPWNYPLQLSLVPLIGSIAAGNTNILKLSRNTPNISKTIKELLEPFRDEFLYVLTDDDQKEDILSYKYDYIFFTGSVRVGKMVYEKASHNLTPVSLELGGKSPCIVTKHANLEKAIKRIVWGKFINAGQTCVAPDYLLLDESIKEEFILKLKEEVLKQFYIDGKISKTFPFIINDKQMSRLQSLINPKNVILGGKFGSRLFEPTIMNNVSFEDKIMQEEIFGPILPIITYSSFIDTIDLLKTKEKPLASYLFSEDLQEQDTFINELSFGGGCINDTIMHLTPHSLPFGGVGSSGIGQYHGIYSFNTFTHQKSVLKKKRLEFNLKYNRDSKRSLNLFKKISKIR